MQTRLRSLGTPIALALLLLGCQLFAGSAPVQEKPWWSTIAQKVILEERFLDKTLPGWSQVAGTFQTVEDPQGDGNILVAGDNVTIGAGGPDWGNYTLEADLRLGDPAVPVLVSLCTSGEAAACEFQASGDADDAAVNLQVLSPGKVISDSERFKPAPVSDWGEATQKEMEKVAAGLQGWRGRWLPLRAEVSHDSIWIWFNGRAIAEVPNPQPSQGGIRFVLPAQSALRRVRVTQSLAGRGTFLPVDLRGYCNNNAVADASAPRAEKPWVLGVGDGWAVSSQGLPPARGLVEVGGVPFAWPDISPGVPDNIDIGESKWRGSGKRYGGFGFYQDPTNFLSAMNGDPATILLRVPKRFYNKMYVLCTADTDRAKTRTLTVRLARYGGANGVYFSDSQVTIPTWAQQPAPDMPAALPVEMSPTRQSRYGDGALQMGSAAAGLPSESGNLWLVEIPLDPCALQSILAAEKFADADRYGKAVAEDVGRPWLEIELTKELHVGPFVMMPLGAPSAVHVLAVTLQESPIDMVVTSDVPGHIFYSTQVPQFNVMLKNVSAEARDANIQVTTKDYYGNEQSQGIQVAVPAGEEVVRTVAVPQPVLGKFDISFRLSDASGRQLLKRDTTFAILPPDTREAERDSPFGMWSWGGGHLTPLAPVGCDLMRKAGVRYTLGVGLEQYGIYTGTQEVIGIFYGDRPIPANPEEDVPKIVQQMKTGTANPEYWLVYWEDTISRRHGTRYPPSLIGEPPLEFNEAEQERFKAYWDRAAAYCKEVRKEMPEAKISLGGYPNFLEEFLRRGFPKEYLDAVSLHQAPYWYLSERPPEIETINGLYFVEQWKKMYGYEDLPTIMIEANFHGTAPGYLTERDQADLYVRDFLIGLAYRVRLFGMSGMIVDVANDYLRSKWGCTALCRNAPEMNPKESFVSYATMTSVLDRAKYLGYVNTGSNTAYALRFRAKDGQNIYVLWTVRGQRDATLKLSADAPVAVIDCMHNQTNLQSAGQAVKVAIGESPVYVKTAADVTAVGLGDPLYSAQPPRDAVLLDSLSNLSNWNPQTGRDQFLEQVNPKYPRRPGNFTYSIVDDPQHGSLLQVTPLQAEGGALLPMYGILERTEAQPIPGQPRKLGLWVKGDSGWGRVIFEVTDANGERWTGVGGLEDRYSNGFFNFDGWRWIEIDLPGYYDNEFPQPSDPDWTPRGRTRIVAYPLSLSKIIIELRTKMVYVTDLVDVPDPSVRISDVMAVY